MLYIHTALHYLVMGGVHHAAGAGQLGVVQHLAAVVPQRGHGHGDQLEVITAVT